MQALLDQSGQRRLAEYLSRIGEILGHDRRRASFATYALGLLSDAERKSIEPIAARSCADDEQVSAVHQQLQHFITDSPWSDREVRRGAARYAIEALSAREPVETWQIDDTGFLKQGTHSVGVQRQYTGSAGKIANCQIGVSLTVATRTEQLPIDFELYLPKSWTESPEQREEAQIPEEVIFKTKVEQACEMIQRAVADDIPGGVVLADAFYGDEPSFRAAVRSQGLHYAVGIKSDNRVWKLDRRGRRCGEPVTVAQLARSLDPRSFRHVTWRQGTSEPLSGFFALQRVIPAYRAADEDLTSRESVWLIIERFDGDTETKYSFASFPRSWAEKRIIRLLKQRWRTERVYQDLKGELGLDHYEGRRYSGWHHHVSVALCCYAFVVADADDSALDHLRIEAAQVELFADGRIHELHRVQSESRDKLLTAEMRRRGHFYYSRAQRQASSSGRVLFAEVHVDIKLIAGQLPTILVLGHQGRDARIHDVQLHQRIWRSVRRSLAAPPFPTITDQTFVQVKLG